MLTAIPQRGCSSEGRRISTFWSRRDNGVFLEPKNETFQPTGCPDNPANACFSKTKCAREALLRVNKLPERRSEVLEASEETLIASIFTCGRGDTLAKHQKSCAYHVARACCRGFPEQFLLECFNEMALVLSPRCGLNAESKYFRQNKLEMEVNFLLNRALSAYEGNFVVNMKVL